LKSGHFTFFDDWDFIVGQTIFKVVSSKVVKHKRVCLDNQHIFILYAFDTFDFPTLDVVDILKRVQIVMYNNVVSYMSQDVVFKMIGFDIPIELVA
jgi:hypothetical protein